MFFLIKRIRAHLGHDKYSAETFDRLLHSMHVEDLDWVVSVTTYAAAIAIALIFGADYFGGSNSMILSACKRSFGCPWCRGRVVLSNRQ